jgi:hypothetical protein
VLGAAALAEEEVLLFAVDCRNSVLAVAAFELRYFELFLVVCCESYLVLNAILTWHTNKIVELKNISFLLRLYKDRVTRGDIGIRLSANFA